MNRDDDNRRAYPTVEEERPVANEFVPKIKNSVKSQTEYNIAFVGPKRHLDSTTSSTVGAGATGEEMANNEVIKKDLRDTIVALQQQLGAQSRQLDAMIKLN